MRNYAQRSTAPAPLSRGWRGGTPHNRGPGIIGVDGPVTSFGVFGLVAGALEPLFPMLVQSGSLPSDILQGPTAQFQRGGFQGTKDLLRHQVVDHRGFETEAHLFGRLMEISDAIVIGPVWGSVSGLQTSTAGAADQQSAEQRRAIAGASLGVRTGPMLAQAFLMRQVLSPGDVGGQAIVLQDLPLVHGDPFAGTAVFPSSRPGALTRAATIGVGP